MNLTWQKDFANKIKFKIWRWVIILNCLSELSAITEILKRGRFMCQKRDVTMERKDQSQRELEGCFGFEDGRGGHKPRNAGSL